MQDLIAEGRDILAELREWDDGDEYTPAQFAKWAEGIFAQNFKKIEGYAVLSPKSSHLTPGYLWLDQPRNRPTLWRYIRDAYRDSWKARDAALKNELKRLQPELNRRMNDWAKGAAKKVYDEYSKAHPDASPDQFMSDSLYNAPTGLRLDQKGGDIPSDAQAAYKSELERYKGKFKAATATPEELKLLRSFRVNSQRNYYEGTDDGGAYISAKDRKVHASLAKKGLASYWHWTVDDWSGRRVTRGVGTSGILKTDEVRWKPTSAGSALAKG